MDLGADRTCACKRWCHSSASEHCRSTGLSAQLAIVPTASLSAAAVKEALQDCRTPRCRLRALSPSCAHCASLAEKEKANQDRKPFNSVLRDASVWPTRDPHVDYSRQALCLPVHSSSFLKGVPIDGRIALDRAVVFSGSATAVRFRDSLRVPCNACCIVAGLSRRVLNICLLSIICRKR